MISNCKRVHEDKVPLKVLICCFVSSKDQSIELALIQFIDTEFLHRNILKVSILRCNKLFHFCFSEPSEEPVEEDKEAEGGENENDEDEESKSLDSAAKKYVASEDKGELENEADEATVQNEENEGKDKVDIFMALP